MEKQQQQQKSINRNARTRYSILSEHIYIYNCIFIKFTMRGASAEAQCDVRMTSKVL